jgi:hypothetical protein
MKSTPGQCPISALKNELIDKIPSNFIVQWDKIKNDNPGCEALNSPANHVPNVNYTYMINWTENSY